MWPSSPVESRQSWVAPLSRAAPGPGGASEAADLEPAGTPPVATVWQADTFSPMNEVPLPQLLNYRGQQIFSSLAVQDAKSGVVPEVSAISDVTEARPARGMDRIRMSSWLRRKMSP